MRIVNIMNFVRQCDPRMEDSQRILLETTTAQVAMVREFGVKNTFLLQYDAVIDPAYQALFLQNRNDNMELGLWLEIVQPLCEKAGIPWRSCEDWPWDWHVVPGFSMAYTPEQRKQLLDIAMEDFKAVFGHWPRSVGSWLLDSVTAAYASEKYGVDMLVICRDQVETDAYTLVGGYFNQGYYPSKNNIFTPAQTAENRVNTPVFRLLGPDPIHNYDNDRYVTNPKYLPSGNVYTLEPAWKVGADPQIIDWFFDGYFRGPCLNLTYVQLGQENSFGPGLLPGLQLQLEKLREEKDVQVWTMAETGAWFRNTFSDTPATCNTALTDWDGTDRVQSVYYNCKNYTANLFRHGSRVFLRSLYLFDEAVPEAYLQDACTTWDATYENLPVVDTLLWPGSMGLTLDIAGSALTVTELRDGSLTAAWGDKQVTFAPEGIHLCGIPLADMDWRGNSAGLTQQGCTLHYKYKGARYSMTAQNATPAEKQKGCVFAAHGGDMVLTFARGE